MLANEEAARHVPRTTTFSLVSPGFGFILLVRFLLEGEWDVINLCVTLWWSRGWGALSRSG